MTLEGKLSAWARSELSDGELLKSLTSAQESLNTHRDEFSTMVDCLDSSQREHCGALEDYAIELLEQTEAHLGAIRQSHSAGSRKGVLAAGDRLGRASFQLNQTLVEFKNQALLVLGPTEIPGLNLLYLLNARYQEEPSPNRLEHLIQAVESETRLASRAVQELGQESAETTTLPSLRNAFLELVGSLNSLLHSLKSVDDGDKPDMFAHLIQLNMSYTDVQRLLPVVTGELKDRGETPYSNLNRILTLISDVANGVVGENPLVNALEHLEQEMENFDSHIVESIENLQLVDSEERLGDVAETLDLFNEGTALVFDFLEARDVALLEQAREQLAAFGQRLAEVELNVVPSVDELAAKNTQPSGNEEMFEGENLLRVFKAVDDLLLGSIDESAYLQVVTKFEEDIETGYRKLSKPKPEASSVVKRSYQDFLAAVQVMRTGVVSLKNYLTTQDETVLKSGVLALNRGAWSLSKIS